jgi:hypothetical protein
MPSGYKNFGNEYVFLIAKGYTFFRPAIYEIGRITGSRTGYRAALDLNMN